jgi:hypothetical protein
MSAGRGAVVVLVQHAVTGLFEEARGPIEVYYRRG